MRPRWWHFLTSKGVLSSNESSASLSLFSVCCLPLELCWHLSLWLLGLLTLSILAWDTFFMISPLTQSSNHCLSSHVAFSPLLTLVDPCGSSSSPVLFSALVNLFLQLIPGRLLPSWSVTRHNNDSPCSESLLTFLLMATCPKDLLLSQVSG